jgi:hypothetical protein
MRKNWQWQCHWCCYYCSVWLIVLGKHILLLLMYCCILVDVDVVPLPSTALLEDILKSVLALVLVLDCHVVVVVDVDNSIEA